MKTPTKKNKPTPTKKKVLIGVGIGLVILAVVGTVLYFVLGDKDTGGLFGGGTTTPSPPIYVHPDYCIVHQGETVYRAAVSDMENVLNDGGAQDETRWLTFLEGLLGSLTNVEVTAGLFNFKTTNNQILSDEELVACVLEAKDIKSDIIFGFQAPNAGENNVYILRSALHPSGVIPLGDETKTATLLTNVIPKVGTNPEFVC